MHAIPSLSLIIFGEIVFLNAHYFLIFLAFLESLTTISSVVNGGTRQFQVFNC